MERGREKDQLTRRERHDREKNRDREKDREHSRHGAKESDLATDEAVVVQKSNHVNNANNAKDDQAN